MDEHLLALPANAVTASVAMTSSTIFFVKSSPHCC
jgi:hypothetical protein